MAWLLAFTMVNVALSTAIMFFLARRRETVAAAPTEDRVETKPSEAEKELSQLQEMGRFFQQMLQSVDTKVADHSAQMQAINREIEANPADTVADQQVLLAAVAQILSVNNKLTSELNTARAELQSQRKQLDILLSEVRTDPLTGLANRRSLDEDLSRRLDQWRRNQTPLSFLMLDVDRFKELNDKYGHPAGDRVLTELARIVDLDLREMDLSARYGGEEFAILLPDTTLEDAGQVAERLRMAIAAGTCEYQGQRLKVTVSVGVTTAMPDDSQQTLVQRADSALYGAKHGGRNRTFANNGEQLSLVTYNANVARHCFRKRLAIAEYRHGSLPDGADFTHYECRDLSAGGLSFVAPRAPQASMLVVEMEDKTGVHFVLARVVSVRNEGTDAEPQFRIGCSFQGRLAETPEIPPSTRASSPTPEAKRV